MGFTGEIETSYNNSVKNKGEHKMTGKRNTTLAEKTSEEIIRYITRNRMMPGEKLPTEIDFLDRLHVSRGTLREAFKVLAARNILEIRQGAGTFISYKKGVQDDPLGLDFIYDKSKRALDMLDIRLMFEPRVAELAAANATVRQRRIITEQAEKVELCVQEGRSYAEADSQFHQRIADASGNLIIGNLTGILTSSIAKNIEITEDTQRESNTIYYHRKILKAIQEGNINNARCFMTMHLSLLREFMLAKIEEK